MVTHLLDTNTWIIHLKDAESAVTSKMSRVPPAAIVTCSVVKAELIHGALKYGNPERRRAKILKALAPLRSLPFDDHAIDSYAAIRHDLELRGQVIGPNDLLIAAIAKANDLTVVTTNTSEFSRVRDLRVEDWTR